MLVRDVVTELINLSPFLLFSCADAVARAIQSHMADNGGQEIVKEKIAFVKGACPECGGIVEHEGGCAVCHLCGYSECH